MDTMIKGKKLVIPASVNICHPLVIPTFPVPHLEKPSVDFMEPSTTSGYLFPNSSRCRRVLSVFIYLFFLKLYYTYCLDF